MHAGNVRPAVRCMQRRDEEETAYVWCSLQASYNLYKFPISDVVCFHHYFCCLFFFVAHHLVLNSLSYTSPLSTTTRQFFAATIIKRTIFNGLSDKPRIPRILMMPKTDKNPPPKAEWEGGACALQRQQSPLWLAVRALHSLLGARPLRSIPTTALCSLSPWSRCRLFSALLITAHAIGSRPAVFWCLTAAPPLSLF